MPSATTLPAPPKGQLSYLYLSHVTFLVSDGSNTVIIDPFLSGEFDWKEHTEKHLDLASVDAADLPTVDAVLISHEHRDHWDVQTLDALRAKGSPDVYAPKPTIDDMAVAGVDVTSVKQVAKKMQMKFGEMTVTCYPSIESEDADEPVQRVGFLVEAHGKTFYHQGDSHGPAKAWQEFRERLDSIVIWPVYVDSYIFKLRPPRIIFHHMDRFEPGDFFCNKDAQKEIAYWQYRNPEIDFVAPERNVWLAV